MDSKRIKVLLVDDDEDDSRLTRELLFEIYGEQVATEWAASYEVALAKIEDSSHDVYLLDYRLGEHSGLDLLKYASTLQIQKPIILLTGQGSTELGREAVRMGAADYLVKGNIDAPLLERAIRYALERKEAQQTLQRQALTFNSIHDGVFFTDVEGKIIDWNPAAEKLTGYTRDEALGRTAAFLQRPHEAATITATIEAGLQREGRWTGELPYVRKDGTEGTVETVVALMSDTAGVPVGVLSTSRDITERKRAEEALLGHARRQEAIAELGQHAIEGADISSLMQKATDLVRQTFNVEFSTVLEMLPGKTELLLTASSGKHEGPVANFLLRGGCDSQAGYALLSGVPVVVEDLRTETRFTDTFLLDEQGLLSGISVIVAGKLGPYSVLGAHSTRTRKFSGDEVQFLQAAANILGVAVERKEAEEALRESEERLRMTWECASDAMALSDPDGTVLFANTAYDNLYGFAPGEAVGQTFALIFPPEYRETAEQSYRSTFSTAHVLLSYEASFERAGGVPVTVESRIAFLSNGGQRTAMLSIVRDISERKETELREHQLRIEAEASEQRFRELVQDLDAIVWEGDVRGNCFTFVSQQAETLLGYPTEQWLCEQGFWLNHVHPDDKEGLLTNYGATATSGTYYTQEYRMITASGKILWLRDIVHVIRDEEGQPVRLRGLLVDITGQKEVERSLQESQERFHQAFDNSAVGMAIVNLDGACMQVNQALCKIVGYSESEFLGKTYQELTHADDLQAEIGYLGQLLAGTIPFYHMEKRYRHQDGHMVWVLLSVALVRDAMDKPLYYISQIQDINERKEAEQALQKSQERFSKAFNASPSPIAINRLVGGEFIDVNSSFVEVFGYSREELIGVRSFDLALLIDDDTRAVVETMLQERGSIHQLELQVRLRSGAVLEMLYSAEVMELEGELCLLSIIVDITERRRSEEELRRSEELFATAFRASPDAFIISRMSDNVILDVNDSFSTTTGYNREEAVGSMATELNLWSDAGDRAQMIALLQAEGTIHNFEAKCKKKSGEHIRGLISAELVQIAGEACMLTMCRDITERKRAEESLRYSEAKNRSLIEAIPDLMIQFSKDGTITDFGAEKGDKVLLAPGEFIGKTIYEILPAPVASQGMQYAEQALKSGRTQIYEYELPAGGKTQNFEARLVVSGHNEVLALIRNVTEAKEAQAALKLSNEILQRVNSLVLVSDKGGRTTYASPSVKRVLGYEPQDLLGDGWWNVSTQGMDEKEHEILRLTTAAQAVGMPQLEPYTRMVPDRSGNLHCILWQDTPGPGDLVIGVGHDITERMRLEAERERLFSVSVDMMCVAGFDGYFKSVNPAFEATLGVSRAELLSKPSIEFVHPDDREATLANRDKLVAGTHTISLDNRYLCGDGSYKWLSWNSVSVVEEGLVYAVARDMTERIEAEAAFRAKDAAEAANFAKSEFLSRMSHELRTPLNAIIGFSQLLGMEELNADQIESVGLVYKAGRHLLDLINEVLEISSIEAGHMSISPEPVSIADVLVECIDLIKPIALGNKIALEGVEVLRCDLHVQVDRQRFKQIILNFLSNAIKYNRTGGEVWMSCEPHGLDQVRIMVNDTGPGIAPEKLERLFMPFERLDADQTGVEGTGLGLALSKRLAQMMGGETGAASVVGQGSCFWVDLPATDAPKVDTPPVAVLPPWGGQASGTVLYIEDNASNLRLIEHIFKQWPNITLRTAMDGMTGFELAREHEPDLVLLDLHLPDLNGDAVLELLRGYPATRRTPVIVISADATPREVARLLGLGANHYITKPIDVRQFIAAVKDALEGREIANVK